MIEYPTYGIIHKVIRAADGKHIGSIYATWSGDGSGGRFPNGVPHGGVLIRAARFEGRVSRGVLDLFAESPTPAALRAFGKYHFS